MNQDIVVWDPTGRYAEGMIFGDNRLAQVRRDGVATLPVDEDLLDSPVAASGYFARAWGDGWPFGISVPSFGCPMVLYARAGREWIHWMARIESIDDSPSGRISMAQNPQQLGANVGGFRPSNEAPIDIAKLGPIDQWGGWTVYGSGRINCLSDGYLGVGLYGAIKNAEVTFTAMTQTTQGR